jgi:hypothetical protein
MFRCLTLLESFLDTPFLFLLFNLYTFFLELQ